VTLFWIGTMLSVRFILSVFSLCTFFSVVAAAPLFDQAPIVPDDTVVDQSSGDPEPQPDLRESVSLLKGWFSPPDYCKCTTKYFEHLAALSTPKDGSLITYSYVLFSVQHLKAVPIPDYLTSSLIIVLQWLCLLQMPEEMPRITSDECSGRKT
jgi:hypothetical protein